MVISGYGLFGVLEVGVFLESHCNTYLVVPVVVPELAAFSHILCRTYMWYCTTAVTAGKIKIAFLRNPFKIEVSPGTATNVLHPVQESFYRV